MISTGTTARQVETLARWALAGVVAATLAVGWWPGLRAWGVLAGQVGIVLTLWVLAAILRGDRSIPAHGFVLVLAVPAAVLIGHVGVDMRAESYRPNAMNGALNVSMVMQLALLAGAMLAARGLWGSGARGSDGSLRWSALGGAVYAASWVPAAFGGTEPVTPAMVHVGLCGVAIWLTSAKSQPAWGRVVIVVAGLAGAAGVAVRDVASAGGAGAAAAVAAGLGGVALSRRWAWRGAFACLLAGGAVLGALLARRAGLDTAGWGWFGQGERALVNGPAASGAALLGGIVGWAGLGATVVGGAAWLAWQVRREAGARDVSGGRRIAWAVAAGLAASALLSGGGLFLPATTLLGALVWGAVPGRMGRPGARWPAAALVVPAAVLAGVLGLSREPGTAKWALRAFGLSGDELHGAVGFGLALLGSWVLGTGRWRLGALGALLGAAVGPIGEVVQATTTRRSAEQQDWAYHVIGSAVALAAYLVCRGARAREHAPESDQESPHAFGPDGPGDC